MDDCIIGDECIIGALTFIKGESKIENRKIKKILGLILDIFRIIVH